MRCSLCRQSFDRFRDDGRRTCPVCGSSSPERLEALLFPVFAPSVETPKVLAMEPSAAKVAWLVHGGVKDARITVGDRAEKDFHRTLRPPHRRMALDLTRLIFPDQCFDLVLCGGVLPFIRSDYLAMSEAHRCLKPEGVAVMTAAVRLPKTKRAAELRGAHPETYTEAYLAENGDEWVYGEDFFERLEAAGFFVARVPATAVSERERAEEGIDAELGLVLCFKFRDALDHFQERLNA